MSCWSANLDLQTQRGMAKSPKGVGALDSVRLLQKRNQAMVMLAGHAENRPLALGWRLSIYLEPNLDHGRLPSGQPGRTNDGMSRYQLLRWSAFAKLPPGKFTVSLP